MNRHPSIQTLLVAVTFLVMAAPTSAEGLKDGIEAFCAGRLAEAFSILEPLAQKGDREAQLIMGVEFRYGPAGKEDLPQARTWFRKAADQGDPEAQVELGLMLAQAQGGEVELVDAVGWFRKAAEAGYAEGQYNLGYAYATGQGVSADIAEGIGWYTKAAEQGHAWAQSNLGHGYTTPGESSTTRVMGYKWLLLASRNGDESAKKQLELVRPLLSTDELSEAERLAAAFEPKPTATTQQMKRRCRTNDAQR